LGEYNLATRSCVTYCGEVLRMGGVEGVPDTSMNIVRWLLESNYPRARA
jgi:hypothetical protein